MVIIFYCEKRIYPWTPILTSIGVHEIWTAKKCSTTEFQASPHVSDILEVFFVVLFASTPSSLFLYVWRWTSRITDLTLTVWYDGCWPPTVLVPFRLRLAAPDVLRSLLLLLLLLLIWLLLFLLTLLWPCSLLLITLCYILSNGSRKSSGNGKTTTTTTTTTTT